MSKRLIMVVLVMFLVVGVAYAGELVLLKSKDQTSGDIPLTFILEKSKWNGTNLYIWGTVKNTGKVGYDLVKMFFTVRGEKGEFIGRQSVCTDPVSMGTGQVGYIEEARIDCEGRKPSSIDFLITGKKEE